MLAAAAALSVAVWPIAASASGIVRSPDVVNQAAGTVSSTAGTTAGGVISQVKDTVTAVVGEAVDSVGQAVGGSSGGSSGGSASGTTATGASSSTSSPSSSSTAKTTGADRSAPASTRSGRALSSTGATSFGATASGLYKAYAPPPPRYGGLSGGTLAITGLDFLLPLGVLVIMLALGLATQMIQRVRDYGALRYRGRHRVPSRWRPQLSPAF